MKPNDKAGLVVSGLSLAVMIGAAYCYTQGKAYQREQDNKAPVGSDPSDEPTVEDTDTPNGPTE